MNCDIIVLKGGVRLDRYRRYLVTIILIITNALVFLLTEVTGGTDNTAHMVRWGASVPFLVTGNGEWYRLFTSMFLHFGIQHLVNNMLILGVMGERLEVVAGHVRFLAVYLLSGVGGNVISLLLHTRKNEEVVSAGASGAIFGLMGAVVYIMLRNKGRMQDLSLRRMAIMIALSVYLGFADGGVDNAAHLGGLVCGFLAAVLLCSRKGLQGRITGG